MDLSRPAGLAYVRPMDKTNQDKLRELMARKMLWELISAAKAQVHVVTWRHKGGPELEDFADALETGRPHPLLLRWEQLRGSSAANRPAPSHLDLIARRDVVLMCEALTRAGLKPKLAVRQLAIRTVKGLFPETPTDAAVRWWWELHSLTPGDEMLIASAIERSGGNHKQIAGRFAALARFALDPTAGAIVPPISS